MLGQQRGFDAVSLVDPATLNISSSANAERSRAAGRIETEEVAAGDTGFRGQGSKNSCPWKQLCSCIVEDDGAMGFGKRYEAL